MTKIKMETRKVKFESMGMDIRKFRKKLIGYGYVARHVGRLTFDGTGYVTVTVTVKHAH